MSRAITLTSILFLSGLAACGGKPSKEVPTAPSEGMQSGTDSLIGADPGQVLPADPELEEFLLRAQFLLRRLSARRPTREEMQRALRTGPAGLAHLAQLTPAELSASLDTLRWQGTVLLQRYPALTACFDEIEREEGPPCDPSDALELVTDLPTLATLPNEVTNGVTNNVTNDVRNGVSQRGTAMRVRRRLHRADLPYIASLILSATTGNPILYLVGSALATRTWAGG